MGIRRDRTILWAMTESNESSGDAGYDPSQPKVMKWKDDPNAGSLGHVAGDIVTFVDDVRVTGYSKSNCWKVYHQLASRVQYLGMHNAPRKFRPPVPDKRWSMDRNYL